jgi:hypothetical protein
MPKCRAYNSDYTGEGESSDRVLDQELIEEFLAGESGMIDY